MNLQLQEDTDFLFLSVLAKLLHTYFLFRIWSFWKLKLLFKKWEKKKVLLLEWTTTKSTIKGNFPFKIILFSVKIWWSGCTENLDAIFMPVIQMSVTQGLVWYHIALWPWLSFTEKVIITVWGVQAKALHNRKRQNHDKCNCWEGI